MPKQLELPLELVQTAKASLAMLSRIYQLKEECAEIRSEIEDLMERHGIKELKKRLSAIRKELEEAESEYRIETRSVFKQLAGEDEQED
jgi:predicted  nucleic acid-binding Zn-ribbon protein